jgi:hypothetical protein
MRTVKNQSDYELSVKIGEANDICVKLKNGTQYFIDTFNVIVRVRRIRKHRL